MKSGTQEAETREAGMHIPEKAENPWLKGLESHLENDGLSGYQEFLENLPDLINANPQEAFWTLSRYTNAIREIRFSMDESAADVANSLTMALFSELLDIQDELRNSRDLSSIIGSYYYSIGRLKFDLLEDLADNDFEIQNKQKYLILMSAATEIYSEIGWFEDEYIAGSIWRPADVIISRFDDYIDGAAGKDLDVFNSFITSPTFLQSNLDILDEMYRDGEAWFDGPGRRFSYYLLEQLGLKDVARFSAAWSEYGGESHYSENLQIIGKLEALRPGSTKLLHETYGITAFHRYKLEQLVRQIDEHGMTDKPYGLVINAINDANGAFNGNRGRGQAPADAAQHAVGSGKYIRVVESEGAMETARTLLKLDKLYGNNHKIEFVVLSVHGAPDELFFDNFSYSPRNIRKSSRFNSAKKLFVPNPLIILESCSTGRDEGIAQHISEALGATVYAPTEDSAILKYHFLIEQGRLKASPTAGHLEVTNNPFSSSVMVPVSKFVKGKLMSRKVGVDDRYS